MNIFYIPSWYPSQSDPVYGIFIKEEIELMARYFPGDNYGISRWGQGEEDLLLWSARPIQSLKKLINKPKFSEKILAGNLKEYYEPTFIWTRKILHGNLENIKSANRLNFEKMQSEHGKIDVVHVYASYPGVILAKDLYERYGVPYILTSHMSPFPFEEFRTRSGQIVSWLDKPIRNARYIIATSQKAARDIGSYNFENIEIIPITRDLDSFQPKSSMGGKVKLLAVGRLVPQKGFDILLEAISGSTFDGDLTIVGEGEDRTILENLVNRFGLQDRVFFTGQKDREGVIKEMQNSDVFVLSSRHETFGNVVVEAAACGKPVIATRCGGPEDIVNDKIGVLVESENVEELRMALDNIPSMLKDYNPKIIREEVVRKYEPMQVLSAIRQLYEDILPKDS